MLGKGKDKGKELRGRMKASEQEWETLVSSLDYKAAPQGLLRDFMCPQRRRLMHEFSQRYYQDQGDASLEASQGAALADMLCFTDGRGRVPLQAVADHFAAHDTAAEAVRTAVQLIAPERAPRVVEEPAPPPQATFISEWLKGVGMEQLNRGFGDQKLETQEDLHGLVKTTTAKDGHAHAGTRSIENKALEKLAPTVGEQGRLGRELLLEYGSNGPAAAAVTAVARKLAPALATEQPTIDGGIICQIEPAASSA